jgi:hypothetical protein
MKRKAVRQINYQVIEMKWEGPITIDKLLDSAFNSNLPVPPLAPSVYGVSQTRWEIEPSADGNVLYVGSLFSSAPRFRTRIGDLVADLFGFFSDPGKKGHYSGAQTMHQFCLDNGINPRTLLIGWALDVECHRYLENTLYDVLPPRLNKVRPSPCRKHLSA